MTIGSISNLSDFMVINYIQNLRITHTADAWYVYSDKLGVHVNQSVYMARCSTRREARNIKKTLEQLENYGGHH